MSAWERVRKGTTESNEGVLHDELERIRVPGGWLYRSSRLWITQVAEGHDSMSESMVFVPEATA